MPIKSFKKEHIDAIVKSKNENIVDGLKFVFGKFPDRSLTKAFVVFMDVTDFRLYRIDLMLIDRDSNLYLECQEVTAVNKIVTEYVLVEDRKNYLQNQEVKSETRNLPCG